MNLSFEENHRFAYNMVLYKHGATLYNGVKDLVKENLVKLATEQVIPAFPTAGGSDPMHKNQEEEMLLKAMRRVWDDHTSSMFRLGQILKYMVSSCAQFFGMFGSHRLGLIMCGRIVFTQKLPMSRRSGRQEWTSSSSIS